MEARFEVSAVAGDGFTSAANVGVRQNGGGGLITARPVCQLQRQRRALLTNRRVNTRRIFAFQFPRSPQRR